MNRKQIRLNESQLNEIVKKAVRRVLREGIEYSDYEKQKMLSRTKNFLDANPKWNREDANISLKNLIRQKIHQANRNNKKRTPISTSWKKAMFEADKIGCEIIKIRNHYGISLNFGDDKFHKVYQSWSLKEKIYFDRLNNQFLRRRMEALQLLYQECGVDWYYGYTSSLDYLGVGEVFANVCYAKIQFNYATLINMGIDNELVEYIINTYNDYYDNDAPQLIRDRYPYFIAFLKSPHTKKRERDEYVELDKASANISESFPSEDEYVKLGKYYVAADVYSDYFDDYDEAYRYAIKIAEESLKEDGEDMEEVHLLDNQKWQSIVIFDYRGIHDLESGTFLPW